MVARVLVPVARAAIVATVVVPLVVIAGASSACACSCASANEAEHYDRARAVFVATLVDREEPPWQPTMSSMDPVALTFRVSQVYKGQVHAVEEVTTARSGASCGLELQGEGPFLVFAHARTDGTGLAASLCGGTRPLSASKPDLGSSHSPLPGVSPSVNDRSDALTWTAGIAVTLAFAGWVLAWRSRRHEDGLRWSDRVRGRVRSR